MIVFKAIKSSKMKDQAMRLGMLSLAHEVEREVKKDFQATTSTWEHKVEFVSMISLKGGVSVLVGTDDDVYSYVSDGTPEHDIAPVNKDYLVYRIGYTPKTSAGSLVAKAGGSYGGYNKRDRVHHPGIAEPRHFDQAIEKRWKTKFRRLVEQMMRDIARDSGHEVA